MNHDVFISYSSKNPTAAQAICHELEDNGIKCWMAPRDITPGKKYGDLIDHAILTCQVFLLVYSADSLSSQWCNGELNVAFAEGKTIIPYRIDATPLKGAMRVILNQTHWIDAYPNYKTRFKDLVAVVGQSLGKNIPYVHPPGPIPQPTPNRFKKYWWAALFSILIIGVVAWYLKLKKDNYLLSLPDSEFVDFENSDGVYGYKLKSTGEIVIPAKFDNVDDFYEGLAAVEYNGRYGYVDKTGKKVVPFKYGDTYSFSEGLALVELKNGKYGFVDKTGKEVIPCEYDDADDFNEGLANVKLNGKWGFIDKAGKEVIPFRYDAANHFSEGLADVILNGRCGYIDKTGKEIISCFNYDSASAFREGLATVKKNDKWGYIDNTGKEVIPCKYDDTEDFHEGLARVSVGVYYSGRKYGFVNKLGQEIIPCEYDDASYVFYEGLASVKLNGKWGFIDKTGKEVIPFRYDGAYHFSEGLAAVKKNDKWGYIDKTGSEIIPCKYYFTEYFIDGLAWVLHDDKWFRIDKNDNRIE